VQSIDLLLIVWGIVTAALVIMVIYRGTLSLHEDDQLFLGDSEAHLAKEQQDLVARLTRLTPIVRLLGITSGGLILVIAGLWIWRGLNAM
jgi:succinate-acetate transporter protein